MKTDWIMEDEESAQELLDLYREARDAVDEKIPRAKEQQAIWLEGKGTKFFLNTWLPAHRALYVMEAELNDE